MNEIKCPNCGEVFTIDESAYAEIAAQIRNQEFEKELQMQLKAKEVELAAKIKELDARRQLDVEKAKTQERESNNEAINNLNLEIQRLKSILENKDTEISLEKIKVEQAKQEALNKKEAEINELKSQLQSFDDKAKLELQQKMSEKEQEILSLKNKVDMAKSESQLEAKKQEENFALQLKQKDEQIAFYKDLKAKASTKMIGESLEQHCHNEFDRVRPMLPSGVYFEKDNDAKTGSKGDFIYREVNSDGVEVISIMFEMKNEADTTATKHKNEHFFQELDKDRKEKGCEYAVLVSLLEADSDYYNAGIVDVSHRYEKMYVVRPQCFIPIITLLRNAALNSVEYKNELARVRNQNVDVTHFEEKLLEFQDGFSRNYNLAKDQFQKAIDEIDETIKHLEKVKQNLVKSENNLRIANDKSQGLTIKKLTYNNPTMKEKFDELKK